MDENREKPFYELDLKKDLIPFIGYFRYSLKMIKNYSPPENYEDIQNRRKARWNHFTLFVYNIALAEVFTELLGVKGLLRTIFE